MFSDNSGLVEVVTLLASCIRPWNLEKLIRVIVQAMQVRSNGQKVEKALTRK